MSSYFTESSFANLQRIAANGLAIWPVAVCGLRHYPPLLTLMRGRKLKTPTAPAIGYIACCAVVLYKSHL